MPLVKIEKVNAPPSRNPSAFSLTKGAGCNKSYKILLILLQSLVIFPEIRNTASPRGEAVCSLAH